MTNLAALRAAVFSLSAKNLRGGGVDIRPPAVRGLKEQKLSLGSNIEIAKHHNATFAFDIFQLPIFCV